MPPGIGWSCSTCSVRPSDTADGRPDSARSCRARRGDDRSARDPSGVHRRPRPRRRHRAIRRDSSSDARVANRSRGQRRIRSLAADATSRARVAAAHPISSSGLVGRGAASRASPRPRRSSARRALARPLSSSIQQHRRARRARRAHSRAYDAPNARLGDQLGRIRVPTAIVWGQQDRVIPLWVGKRLQQAIPGATLNVVPGARHFTPEKRRAKSRTPSRGCWRDSPPSQTSSGRPTPRRGARSLATARALPVSRS